MVKPYLIEFSKIGEPGIGYISVTEASQNIPFRAERVFWTYFTPESIVRGRHAHYTTEQVLVAVSGRIVVTTEMPDGEVQTFVLDQPNIGVYVPPHAWHTMQYSHNAVQVVFASSAYAADDYIRDYYKFKEIWGSKAE